MIVAVNTSAEGPYSPGVQLFEKIEDRRRRPNTLPAASIRSSGNRETLVFRASKAWTAFPVIPSAREPRSSAVAGSGANAGSRNEARARCI